MKKIIWILPIVFGTIGFLILAVSIFLIVTDSNYFSLFSKLDSKVVSELGEYITGFVGIFWTGAAALLIFATFQEQKKQNDRLQFESTFFNMISTYHNIVNQTEGNVNGIDCKGRKYYSNVLLHFKSSINTDDFCNYIVKREGVPEIESFLKDFNAQFKKDDLVPNAALQLKEKMFDFEIGNPSIQFTAARYEYYFNKYQDNLSHYFRFIYNIFKFTVEERSKYKDARRYINLIQAQMSKSELAIMFYNSISKFSLTIAGEKRFYNWLNEFDFFENIDPDSLIKKEHQNFYPTIYRFNTRGKNN